MFVFKQIYINQMFEKGRVPIDRDTETRVITLFFYFKARYSNRYCCNPYIFFVYGCLEEIALKQNYSLLVIIKCSLCKPVICICYYLVIKKPFLLLLTTNNTFSYKTNEQIRFTSKVLLEQLFYENFANKTSVPYLALWQINDMPK